MPTYKVKEGKSFGLLAAGEEVQLTEEQAKIHESKLDRVADTRNDLNMRVDPSQKLIQTEGGKEKALETTDEGTIAEKTDYGSLTVAELRGELERHSLSTVGNKAELVARLQEDDKSD